MSIEVTKHNEISYRAYLLWENAGRPAGRDQEFWFAAEQEVLGSQARPATQTKQSAPAPQATSFPNRVRGVKPGLTKTGRRNGG